ncbi:AmmeMemoRadiSam system protein B [Gemmatimonadota bacterium]
MIRRCAQQLLLIFRLPLLPKLPLLAVALASFPHAMEAQHTGIREPAVAGPFYPADPEVLAGMIRDLLEAEPRLEADRTVLAGIVPHAGLAYSGRVAARLYRLLEGRTYEAVVVLAPSHHELYAGATIWPGEGLATPLGTVLIQHDLAERMVAVDDSIDFSTQGYGEEHSLEVQLPFLQTVLPGVPIIPLMLGRQSLELSYHLARTLGALLEGRNVLILASSDLSHFHSAEEARWLDEELLDLVRGMDPFLLGYKVFTGRMEACGVGGIVTALETARRLGAQSARILTYAHSGEVTGDNSRVVGYASAALEDRLAPGSGSDGRERELLLTIARNAVEASVNLRPHAPLLELPPGLMRKQGAFVTLRIGGVLRGCVGGVLAEKPLAYQVRDSAIAAAMQDERFAPVSPSDLSRLQYEVSLLTPLHPLDDPDDIVIGRDGLLLVRGPYSGVLLPNVAVEQGWDTRMLLRQIGIKAGLGPDAWRQPGTLLLVFSAEHFH